MKKLLILLTLLIIFLPFNVFALEGKIVINFNKTKVSPGDTLICTLKGNVTEGQVSSLSAKVLTSESSNPLVLQKVTVDSIWVGDGDEGIIALYGADNKTGTFNIATLTFKASTNITSGTNETVTISNILFYDKNFDEVKIAEVSQNIRITSTINTLSNLTLSTGTLSPTFNESTLNYQATIDATNVTINATAKDENSKITGNIGQVNLNYGLNTFKINVTSESQTVKTYTLSITRPDNRDTDNTLSSLTINNNQITLDKNKNEYTYEVDNDVTTATIEATLNSKNASFIDGYTPKKITLSDGKNTIQIKVMAENEEIKTYTIIINKKSKTTTNNSDKVNNNQNNTNQNNTSNDNNISTNPKTGSLIYIVLIIFIISIIVGVYSYENYKKKVRKDSNEKK